MALTNPKKSSSIEAFMKIFQPFVDSIQIEGFYFDFIIRIFFCSFFFLIFSDFLSFRKGETGVFDPPKLKFITPKTDMRVYSAISGNRKKALVEQKLRSHDDPNLSFNFVQSVGKRCLAECAGNSNSGFFFFRLVTMSLIKTKPFFFFLKKKIIPQDFGFL